MLLVTGAGASRNLGDPERPALPLMADWSESLCTALDDEHEGLAAACALRPGMDGEEFEKALGLLLLWKRVQWLEERFAQLGGRPIGNVAEPIVQAREVTKERFEMVMRVINDTLYREFGLGRVDDDRATEAYQALFDKLDVSTLVVATTNYDRAGEVALTNLGWQVEEGFRRVPHRTPEFDVQRLAKAREVRLEGSSKYAAYIHLHGSVGWYVADGKVREYPGDQDFNATLGTPVVLYPDPDKDPTSDAIVSDLWREFHAALNEVDHVLVLGHSLHDPALVRAIRESEPRHLAVTMHEPSNVVEERIKSLLPSAIPVSTDFGPELTVDVAALQAFRGDS